MLITIVCNPRLIADGPLIRYAKLLMGLLLDTQNCGLCMRRECRGRFPRHRLERKPLVSDPGMHLGTCVTHVPWCMLGSLPRGGGENVPGIPDACATRNITYLARGPWLRAFWLQDICKLHRDVWSSACVGNVRSVMKIGRAKPEIKQTENRTVCIIFGDALCKITSWMSKWLASFVKWLANSSPTPTPTPPHPLNNLNQCWSDSLTHICGTKGEMMCFNVRCSAYNIRTEVD